MNKNYPFIILFYVGSFISVLSMETWFTLWMFLEMNTLTFISMMIFFSNSKSSENSFSYFLIQSISSIFLMNSLFLSLISSHLFNISSIFLISLMLKLSMAPTHSWFIPLALNSSWTILLYLLTLQKIIPIMFLEVSFMEMNLIVILFCMINLFMGSLKNLSSNSLKSILIFSSISNMSWVTSSIFISSNLWKMFILIYFMSLLFIFLQQSKKKMTVNFLIFLNFMSMSGMPPLMGFFPKMIIITKMIEFSMKMLILFFLLFSILDLFMYLKQNYLSNMISQARTFNNKLYHKQVNFLLLPWLFLNFLLFFFFL